MTLFFSFSKRNNLQHNFSGATSIDAFSLRDNAWRSLAAMSSRRLQFGAVVVDKKLIVAGGRDGLKTLNTVECFDFSTLTWSTLPPMNVHRHGLGICQCRKVYEVNAQFISFIHDKNLW